MYLQYVPLSIIATESYQNYKNYYVLKTQSATFSPSQILKCSKTKRIGMELIVTLPVTPLHHSNF